MSERFRLNCKRLLTGVACGLAMLVLASGQARAGILEIVISDGTTSYDILDDGPLDTLIGPNVIQALAPALVFPDFKVVGLSAATNNPGMENPTGATLTVSGEIQRITGGASATLTINVTDTDYTLPTGTRTLTSNASSTFTSVPAGDTHSFTSWYNPSNAPLAHEISSGTITYTAKGVPSQTNSTPDPLMVTVGPGGTYGLTNTTVLTMAGAPSGTTPDISFGGNTVVLGTAVPEPASLAIMLPALPVVIMGWFRHRKARATSAN
jgi:hypothetical protein